MSLISEARKRYHQRLVEEGVLAITSGSGGCLIASNADKSNKPSKDIALQVAQALGAKEASEKQKGQTAGKKFEKITAQFITETFLRLSHLRPGNWEVLDLGNANNIKTSNFSQYSHLEALLNLQKQHRELTVSLGNNYLVAPDIVVFRHLCSDEEINKGIEIVGDSVCLRSDLRKQDWNVPHPVLHASISAKWTMRSDRAQNSRTEALALIRERKGRLPHIVVVTGEPTPSRLASLALGTGDIDCVYHFALNELIDAVDSYSKNGREDMMELLQVLIDGKRLKDISDLPLDLCV